MQLESMSVRNWFLVSNINLQSSFDDFDEVIWAVADADLPFWIGENWCSVIVG